MLLGSDWPTKNTIEPVKMNISTHSAEACARSLGRISRTMISSCEDSGSLGGSISCDDPMHQSLRNQMPWLSRLPRRGQFSSVDLSTIHGDPSLPRISPESEFAKLLHRLARLGKYLDDIEPYLRDRTISHLLYSFSAKCAGMRRNSPSCSVACIVQP
jgi:hypothetical protein